MSKKFELKPIAAAVAAALTVSVMAMPIANADANPFDLTELSSGYMVAEMEEGKCGEGKAAAEKMEEGKCGEGKCGEGKCGEGEAAAEKMEEGKCGEGKCGES